MHTNIYMYTIRRSVDYGRWRCEKGWDSGQGQGHILEADCSPWKGQGQGNTVADVEDKHVMVKVLMVADCGRQACANIKGKFILYTNCSVRTYANIIKTRVKVILASDVVDKDVKVSMVDECLRGWGQGQTGDWLW